MADKFRKTYPLKITFAEGEQPTAAKLTAISSQTRNGLDLVERAVGDIWTQSADAHFTDYPLHITNLGRMIGENVYLNPTIYPLTADFNFKEHIGLRHTDLTETYLNFKPKDTGDNSWHNQANSEGIFNTSGPVATEQDVNSTGDWWVDRTTGRLRTYDPLTIADKIVYTVAPSSDWHIGQETLPSVIPDPGQDEYEYLRVSKDGSTFYIHLPPRHPLNLSDREKPSNYPIAAELADVYNFASATGAPNRMFQYGTQALDDDFYRYSLPKEIWDAWDANDIGPGDEFGHGVIMLWDDNTQTVIDDVIFRRPTSGSTKTKILVTSNTFDFEGLQTATEVEASYATSKLKLITCGSPLTRVLWTLASGYYQHTHDNTGTFGPTISHGSLAGLNPPPYTAGTNPNYPSVLPAWSASNWVDDPHTSLLSRAGSVTSGTNRDVNKNAMLGHLLMGSMVEAGSPPDFLSQDMSGATETSFRIYWGDTTGPFLHATSGAHLRLVGGGGTVPTISDAGTASGDINLSLMASAANKNCFFNCIDSGDITRWSIGMYDTGGQKAFDLYDGTNSAVRIWADDGHINFQPFTTDTSGKVGIFTSTPVYPVHIDPAAGVLGGDQLSLFIGPSWNGGTPYNAGNQKLGVFAWTGRAGISLAEHNVDGWLISTEATSADLLFNRGYSGAGGWMAAIREGSTTRLDLQCDGEATNFRAFRAMNASMTAGQILQMNLGQADANGNCAEISFQYNGNDSSDNRLHLGFHSNQEVVRITNGGQVGINVDPTYALHVSGEIFTTNRVTIADTSNYIHSNSGDPRWVCDTGGTDAIWFDRSADYFYFMFGGSNGCRISLGSLWHENDITCRDYYHDPSVTDAIYISQGHLRFIDQVFDNPNMWNLYTELELDDMVNMPLVGLFVGMTITTIEISTYVPLAATSGSGTCWVGCATHTGSTHVHGPYTLAVPYSPNGYQLDTITINQTVDAGDRWYIQFVNDYNTGNWNIYSVKVNYTASLAVGRTFIT